MLNNWQLHEGDGTFQFSSELTMTENQFLRVKELRRLQDENFIAHNNVKKASDARGEPRAHTASPREGWLIRQAVVIEPYTRADD